MEWFSRRAGRSRVACSIAIAALVQCVACRNRAAAPHLAASTSVASLVLKKLATGNLSDAYAGGATSANAIYQGRRYTVVGNVVSVGVEAGEGHVMLGSTMQPVLAMGIDRGAVATLAPSALIEIDCTVMGSIAEVPTLDCGPNGAPRTVSAP